MCGLGLSSGVQQILISAAGEAPSRGCLNWMITAALALDGEEGVSDEELDGTRVRDLVAASGSVRSLAFARDFLS